MSEGQQRVVVGMSGGVDSTVAAYILKEQGFEVIGVMLKTWEGEDNRCCDIEAAAQSARGLGLEFRVWNAATCFAEKVFEPFRQGYLHGCTPNPCVDCNRHVKWERLIYIANVLDATFVATGHYAGLTHLADGRLAVKKAVDTAKDQSYMLYRLTQEQLARTVFPLGSMTKADVRRLANEVRLPVAQKADSQEICFVTDGKYTDFIGTDCPVGNFVDENGKILGKHKGIIHYTVGQRKGLGLALGYPVYVQKLNVTANEVVLGGEQSLYKREIMVGALNFMGVPDIREKITATVKIRYQHGGESGIIERIAADLVKITFVRPVRAPAPGQSAVFYTDDGIVIGGGKIVNGGSL